MVDSETGRHVPDFLPLSHKRGAKGGTSEEEVGLQNPKLVIGIDCRGLYELHLPEGTCRRRGHDSPMPATVEVSVSGLFPYLSDRIGNALSDYLSSLPFMGPSEDQRGEGVISQPKYVKDCFENGKLGV